MKYSELLGVLAAMTPDELDQEVVWWGDERGGKITSVFVLPENYATLDRGDPLEPESTLSKEDDEEIVASLPAGTVILMTDEED